MLIVTKNAYFVDNVILSDLSRHTTLSSNSYHSKTNPYNAYISMYDHSQLEVPVSFNQFKTQQLIYTLCFKCHEFFEHSFLFLNVWCIHFWFRFVKQLPKTFFYESATRV